MSRFKTKEAEQSWRNKTFTPQRALKISLSMKGRIFSLEHRKRLSEGRKGMKFTDEHRKNISDYVKAHPVNYWSGKKRQNITGVKHPCYKGYPFGENHKIRTSTEFKFWRTSVFVRDNFTCQMPGCEKRGVYLEAHHIKTFAQYPELRFDRNNGITLCAACHNKTKGGKEYQFENLFQEIIKLKD